MTPHWLANFIAFVSTPMGATVAVVAFIALVVAFKVAKMIVRVLALLLSLVTIGWFIYRAKYGG